MQNYTIAGCEGEDSVQKLLQMPDSTIACYERERIRKCSSFLDFTWRKRRSQKVLTRQNNTITCSEGERSSQKVLKMQNYVKGERSSQKVLKMQNYTVTSSEGEGWSWKVLQMQNYTTIGSEGGREGEREMETETEREESENIYNAELHHHLLWRIGKQSPNPKEKEAVRKC